MSSRAGRLVAAIPAYRSGELLERCLSSLRYERFDVICVFENGSPQESKKKAKAISARFSNVLFVDSEKNLGFGEGVNRACEILRVSREDILLVLNVDVELSQGVVRSIENFLLQTPCAIVAPTIMTDSRLGPRVWYSGGHVSVAAGFATMRSLARNSRDRLGGREVGFAPGTVLGMSGQTWALVGGFRRDFFLYFEDVDFCMRARMKGAKIFVLPALVWHQVGGSSSRHRFSKPPYYFYYMTRNRLWLFGENPGALQLLLGQGIAFTSFLLLKAFFSTGIRENLTAIYRGVIDGLRSAPRFERAYRPGG